ncbi:hypothetical protein KW548_08180 [Vibrio neptunius]|nr:hypothetical protein [Vibrio neptunius]QXX07893.1 hypothetical protein KW548_08180 [Vibrio neptunius]
MSNKDLTDIVSQPDITQYKNNLVLRLLNSKRPFVHYPPSARGDMNAYKYVAFKEEMARPITVFEYFDSPREGSEQEEFNRNIPAINQHIRDLGLLKEGRDYVWLTTKDVNEVKSTRIKSIITKSMTTTLMTAISADKRCYSIKTKSPMIRVSDNISPRNTLGRLGIEKSAWCYLTLIGEPKVRFGIREMKGTALTCKPLKTLSKSSMQ